MQSVFETMGGTYTQSGDYLIPNIALPATAPLGRWGRQRRKYLQENQEAYFLALLLTEKLYEHLTEVDQRAEELIEKHEKDEDEGNELFHEKTSCYAQKRTE